MLFTSLVFLLYFLPVVLIFYFVFGFSRVLQNIWLLLASLLFYAWGEPIYVFLMMGSILLNYAIGILIHKYRSNRIVAKWITVFGSVLNIGILFVFKYLNFLVRNINQVLEKDVIVIQQIVLPIGISFFTFQALSYIIDVYRGTAKVEKNPLYVGLYISFFPQLIAGPIVKFSTISEQIRGRKITVDKFCAGTSRFAVGFCKKILLANNMAIVADYVYGMTAQSNAEVPVLLAWIGAIAYTLQIFFDFSAYSDMAIGLGLMFGFLFEENFNYPYISKSVGEFWRRWHISLSSWFAEYVYFPLGGSKVNNQDTMVRNLLVVWLLTGIWHGAEWTFILWGLINFLFILLERFFDFEKSKIPSVWKHMYLLVVICLTFMLFRAASLEQAGIYISNMFGLNGNGFFSSSAWMLLKEYGVFFMAGIVFSMPIGRKCEKLIIEKKIPVAGRIMNMMYPAVLLFLVILSVSYLVKGSYNPFIYFNF